MQVPFFGITAEGRQGVVRFVDGMGSDMDYTVACDLDGNVQEAFQSLGMKGIPFAAVVDADRNVIFSGHPMEPAFEEAVTKLNSAGQLEAARASKLAVAEGKSRSELAQLSVKELKGILAALSVSAVGCVEKGDLVSLAADSLGLD